MLIAAGRYVARPGCLINRAAVKAFALTPFPNRLSIKSAAALSRSLHAAAHWTPCVRIRPGINRTGCLMATDAAADEAASLAAAAESAGALQGTALWSRMQQVYESAQASGAATKTDTEVHLVHDPSLGVHFVVRLATALRAKPQGMSSKPPEAAVPKAPVNPFLPYEQALWVAHLSDTHTLLLNKFNVVKHHVLVVTRAFQSQQDPLNAHDLAAAWTTLHAMPQGGIAFYNCGQHSGRSQPHKHLQVVPLPLADGHAFSGSPLQPIALAAVAAAGVGPHIPVEVMHLPYRCYAALLDLSPSSERLEATFNALLHMAHSCSHDQNGEHAQQQENNTQGHGHIQENGMEKQQQQKDSLRSSSHNDERGQGQQQQHSSAVLDGTSTFAAKEDLSYNVVLTREVMMVVPRSRETCGPLAINSLGFAGTILVRASEDVEFVKQKGPAAILAAVGQPW